jgi:dihydrolipoamide dehydrogenase
MKKNKVTWVKGPATLASARRSRSPAPTRCRRTPRRRPCRHRDRLARQGDAAGGLELDKTTVLSSDEALTSSTPRRPGHRRRRRRGLRVRRRVQRLRHEVTLIEALPRILPLEDADCSAELGQGVQEARHHRPPGAKLRRREGGQEQGHHEGRGGRRDQGDHGRQGAHGRRPRAQRRGIGLEAAGVKLTDRGFIKINEKFETSAKGVYAIGDVAGPPMLAHKGSRGPCVAEVLAASTRTPSTTTTSPTPPTATPRWPASASPRSSARSGSSTTRSASSPSRPTAAPAPRARPKAS